MMRLKKSKVQPIGLDVGHDSIKMLQLEVVGDALAVVAAARQELPAEAKADPRLVMPAAVDLIRKMLRHGDFHGRQVVAAVPRHSVYVKNLRLPVMPADELMSAIRFEGKNLFPFDMEGAAVRFLQAGEVRQGNDVRQEVVVLAAQTQEINDHLEQLHRAGVIVESLDAEACALFRGIERFIRRREDEQQVHVLVDVGARRTQVVIGKGRDISFYKPIDIGGRQLAEAVSKKLGITLEEAYSLRRRLTDGTDRPADAHGDAQEGENQHAERGARRDPVRQAVFDATRSTMEELSREISLCLRYYSVTFRGQRPTRLRLVGGEARDPQLQALLNAAMTLPLELARPLEHVDVSAMADVDRRGTMGEWAVALGLGLRMTKERFVPADSGGEQGGAVSSGVATGRGSTAQIVDMEAAVRTAGAGQAPAAVKERGPAAEATHA